MDIVDAIILGIIQGLTEFLPVSSSGHLEIGREILNADLPTNDPVIMEAVNVLKEWDLKTNPENKLLFAKSIPTLLSFFIP